MVQSAHAPRRTPLSREIVLRAAFTLADDAGIDAVTMRNLAQELDVVPMALYKHVANKEELLDGMVDLIVGEFDPPTCGAGWKDAIRQRILSARQAMLRHRWAPEVIRSRTHGTPVVLEYLNSLIATFRAGGFSVDLIHQVMHALGSRTWGFSLEVFAALPPADSDPPTAPFSQQVATNPDIGEIAPDESHEEGSTAGRGCDDQLEFEFGLDVLLDGFERLHQQGWTPSDSSPPTSNDRASGRARSTSPECLDS